MSKMPIIGTIKNSISFVNGNSSYAVQIILPFAVFLILAELLTAFSSEVVTLSIRDVLVALVYLVIYTVAYGSVVMSWHRYYLQGASKAHPVNLLAIKSEEWQFIGKILLFGLVSSAIIVLLVILGAVLGGIMGMIIGVGISAPQAISPILAVLGMITGFSVGFIAVNRFALYFPAKAIGHYISFRESFRLMKNFDGRLALMQTITGAISVMITVSYGGLIKFIFHRDIFNKYIEAFNNPEGLQEMPDGDFIYTAKDGTIITIGERMSPTLSPEGILEFVFSAPVSIIIVLYFILVAVCNLSQTYRSVMERS